MYFGEEDTYASSVKDLEWQPVGWKKKPWSNDFELSPEFEPLYSYTIVEASATHFLVRAEGNIDRDQTLDVWEIDHFRTSTNVVNDLSK